MNDGKGEWTVMVFGTQQTFEVECDPTFEDNPNRRYILKIFPKDRTQIKKELLVIMINPSTADEKKSDQTCRALLNLCDYNNYTNITICNLFSLRTSKVEELNEKIYEANDTQNNDKLTLCIGKFNEVLCAWGKASKIKKRGDYDTRINQVYQMLNGKKLKKIGNGLVDDKYPIHPYSFSFQKNGDKYKIDFEEFNLKNL